MVYTSEKELELLSIINKHSKFQHQALYDCLFKKYQIGNLTKIEAEKLTDLTEQSEANDLICLEAVADLALIRNESLDETIKKIGESIDKG